MSNVSEKVRNHFHADASRFDAIYQEEKGLFNKFIDNWWRGVVRRRLEINVEKFKPFEGKKILDVGCGSGRFCFEYAKNGAKEVVGIDFAPAMIELSNKLANEFGVADKCRFYCGTFPEDLPKEKFDGASANGFFDYTDKPVPLIAAMKEVTQGKIIMSFPKAIEWRVPLRRIRFWLKGTPLFLYREAQVKEILREAGITNYEWINLDRDYLVIAEV